MKKQTLVVICFAVGCGLVPRVERLEFEDEGDACLTLADPMGEFPIRVTAEDDLVIQVYFPAGCLSSSCSEVLTAECTATVEGDRITVTSRGTVEHDETPGRACTEDCGMMTAECSIPMLADGTYTIVHGGDEKTVTIPGEPECSGEF